MAEEQDYSLYILRKFEDVIVGDTYIVPGNTKTHPTTVVDVTQNSFFYGGINWMGSIVGLDALANVVLLREVEKGKLEVRIGQKISDYLNMRHQQTV